MSSSESVEASAKLRPRPVAKDLVWSVAGQFSFKLLGFVVLTLLARKLTPSEFGLLMFALATSELIVLATEFGSSTYLTREVAIDPGRALHLLGGVLGPRLLLLIAYLMTMLAIGKIVAPHSIAILMTCALYAGLKDLYRAFNAVFVGSRRIVLGIIPFASHQCVLAAGLWTVMSLRPGVGAAALVHLAAGIWLTVASIALLRRHFGIVRPSLAGFRRVVRASLPLFGLGALTMLQLRLDATLLGLLGSYADVAAYAASARLFEASQALVRPLITVFLPVAAGLAAAAAYRALRRSLYRLLAAALAAGAVAAMTVVVIADQVVLIVYGANYASSADVLRIHFAATPSVFIGAVALFHVIALRRERLALVCAVGGLLVNVTLDLLLIPEYGAIGAAWATLAAETATATGLVTLAWFTLVTLSRGDGTRLGADAPKLLTGSNPHLPVEGRGADLL